MPRRPKGSGALPRIRLQDMMGEDGRFSQSDGRHGFDSPTAGVRSNCWSEESIGSIWPTSINGPLARLA